MCKDFVAGGGENTNDWVGRTVDMFSPDDPNAVSYRYIDFKNKELEISAQSGKVTWGKKFDPKSNINPTFNKISVYKNKSSRKTNFASKIPKTDSEDVKKQVKNGALKFTVTMGHVNGKKVLKWNGMYDGKGGIFGDKNKPASDCDNFWQYE